MWTDEIVEQVRAERQKLTEQHGNDLDQLFKALQQLEADSGRAVVSRPPRRPRNAADTAA